MIAVLQALAILLVAVLLATTLGHALEMPGKMRLDREAYFKTQTIYWPGFTVIGGGAEILSMVVTFVLALLLPTDGRPFWLTLGALALLAALHAIYWFVTHPINKLWVKDLDLKGGGKAFFDTGSGPGARIGWEEARDRWEYSHTTRAFLNLGALLLLATSAVLSA